MLHYLPEKFRYILKSMSQLLHRTGVQKVLEIITAQTLVNIYKNDGLHCCWTIYSITVALLPGISWHSCCCLKSHKIDETITNFPWWIFGEPQAIFLHQNKDITCWKMVHQRYFSPVPACLYWHQNKVLQSSVHVLGCLQQWWILASSTFWHQETWKR